MCNRPRIQRLVGLMQCENHLRLASVTSEEGRKGTWWEE